MIIERLADFRNLMDRYGLDAYIVTDSDPHSGEYTAAHWKTRAWLSGFTGSNGTLVVTRDKALLWTDGRYYIQAEKQLAGTTIELMKAGEPGTPTAYEWIAMELAVFGGKTAMVGGRQEASGEKSATVGVDGKTTSCVAYDELKKALNAGDPRGSKSEGNSVGAQIVIDHDLAGELWTEGRPSMPDAPIFIHEARYAGKSVAEKLGDVRRELRRRGASCTLIAGLEDVAWLYNIRGDDIMNLPVAYAYAFVSDGAREAAYGGAGGGGLQDAAPTGHREDANDGAGVAELYIDAAKVPADVREELRANGVCVKCESDLQARLESLGASECISCDMGKINKWLHSRIPSRARIVNGEEPTILLKAIKNETELRGHRESQILDGAAMARFLMWIEREAGITDSNAGECADGAVVKNADAENGEIAAKSAGNIADDVVVKCTGECADDAGAPPAMDGGLNEWDAVLALRRFRAMSDECRGDSFGTIAGYGPNGAMMHYAPSEAANSPIRNSGLMVVDTGGQYPGGTTDITRTIVFGNTTLEERTDFTLTLKSHIALASARFLYGALGGHIDSIARKVMWDHGLDYKCGTGHGVGCYLSVHEGPQSISMRASGGARLEENMIVSIEPGVYREGRYGVRIENLARIAEDFTNEFGRFMKFEILSFCPIDLRGVETEMLNDAEREWLNNYHRDVYEKISPLLNEDERVWLANATRKI